MRRRLIPPTWTLPGVFDGRILVMQPEGWKADGTGKAIYCFGGHNGSSSQWVDGGILQDHPRQWARAGYLVVSVPYGPQSWGGPDVTDSTSGSFTQTYNTIRAAYNHQVIVGLAGYSMGGLAALNCAKRFSSVTGAMVLFEPVTDLDWVHGTAAYTPSYSLAYVGSAYNGGSSGTAAGAYPQTNALVTAQSLAGGISSATTLLTTTTIPQGILLSSSFTLGGLTVTYTGISGASFTGVTTSAGTTVASGTSFTPAYAPNVGWAGEVESAFRVSLTTTTQAAGGVASGGLVFVAETIPALTPTSGTFTLGALTVTYTGWSNAGTGTATFNAFTGVSTNLTGATTVPAGTSFTPPSGVSTYASATAGYRVRDEYSTWSAIPGFIIHAADDTVVPPAMSDAFATGAGAKWSVRSPKPSGSHTQMLIPANGVSPAETVGFLLKNL